LDGYLIRKSLHLLAASMTAQTLTNTNLREILYVNKAKYLNAHANRTSVVILPFGVGVT
jgi:hypothetical protein